MANRRMFSVEVVCTDKFLEMPTSSQALYFQLGMKADDDGFVSAPKQITRMTNASDDDLKLLASKGFIIPFESGVIVISDWKVNNYLRKDRYTETRHVSEKSKLQIVNDVYVPQMSVGIPTVNHMVHQCETQVSIGKDRDREREIDIILCPEPKAQDRPPVISLILNDKTEHPVYQEEIEEWKELYPAVDILQELRKMKGWLDANPTKRKTKKGIKRFINGWLSREQDKGGNKLIPEESPEERRERERQENMREWEERQKNKPKVAPVPEEFDIFK